MCGFGVSLFGRLADLVFGYLYRFTMPNFRLLVRSWCIYDRRWVANDYDVCRKHFI